MNNDNDDDFFKKAMQGIKPIAQDTHHYLKKPKKFKKGQTIDTQRHQPTYKHVYDVHLMDQSRWVDGDASLSFKHSSISTKIFNQLKQGKYPWEARLDLHQMTVSHAMAAVDQLINQCLAENIRYILIIHGKGYMSHEKKPILKNILIEHLRENQNVLAYHSAKAIHGGTGALYVLLKSGHKAYNL